MEKFDVLIESLLAELEELKGQGVYPNIDRTTAEYLYEMIQTAQPARIVEVGACNGYSTIWFGLAAQEYGGKVETIEYTEKRFQELVQNITKAGLQDIVHAHYGDAMKILPDIQGDIDFLFLDAMKRQYIEYIKLLEERLKPGSIVVADNIHSHREKLNDFVEYVKMNSDFESRIEDIGTGLLIAKKIN